MGSSFPRSELILASVEAAPIQVPRRDCTSTYNCLLFNEPFGSMHAKQSLRASAIQRPSRVEPRRIPDLPSSAPFANNARHNAHIACASHSSTVPRSLRNDSTTKAAYLACDSNRMTTRAACHISTSRPLSSALASLMAS